MNAETRERKSIFRFACGFELGIGLVGAALGFLLGPDVWIYLFRGGPSVFEIGAEVAVGVLAAVPTVLAVWLLMKLPLESVQELKRFGEQPAMQRLLRLDHARLLLLSLCSGVGEEIAFRGWLFPWLLEFSKSFTAGDRFLHADLLPLFLAIAVSSVIFGVVHPHTRLYMVVTALIGVYYAGLLVVSNSLLIPVFAHAAHNAAQFVMAKRESERERSEYTAEHDWGVDFLFQDDEDMEADHDDDSQPIA